MWTGYYIYEVSVEKEAVDRWENEGGRLGEDYLRHMDQVMPGMRFEL